MAMQNGTRPLRGAMLCVVMATALAAGCGTRVVSSESAGRATDAVGLGQGTSVASDGSAATSPRAGGTSTGESGGMTASSGVSGAVAGSSRTGGGVVGAPASIGARATPGAGRAPGAASAAGSEGGAGRSDGATAASNGTAGAKPVAPGAPTAPGTGHPAVVGGSRSPVLLASVGTMSGPAGTVFGPIVQGAQVWVKWINDKGGLNGHPVRLITFDDGGDPARHRSQVQQAVEKEHVHAFFVDTEGLTGEPSVDYINQHRVPVIGTDTATPWAYRSPMHFIQASAGDAATFGVLAAVAEQVVPKGETKLATITCVEASFCEASDRVFASMAKDLGFQTVYRARVSLAQPDFTAECLNARSAGAETFMVIMDVNSLNRLGAACARQGYHPVFGTGSGIIADRLKDDPNLAGMVAGTNVFPSFQSGTPATDEYQQAWKLFGGGKAAGEGPPIGWTAGKLLQKATVNLGEPPSSEAILEGLWTIHDDTLGGLTAPLNFVKDQPIKPNSCWFTIGVADGRWISPDNFRQRCRAMPAG